MRGWTRAAVWLTLLAAASPAWAQTTKSFGNVDTRHLTFKPVDTTKALAMPIPSQQSKSFSLTHFFPSLSLPSFLSKPKIGTSPYPDPSTFPSTKYKSPLKPMAPFVPKN
jgi:hypothetical protein